MRTSSTHRSTTTSPSWWSCRSRTRLLQEGRRRQVRHGRQPHFRRRQAALEHRRRRHVQQHPINRGGMTKAIEAVRQLRGEAHPRCRCQLQYRLGLRPGLINGVGITTAQRSSSGSRRHHGNRKSRRQAWETDPYVTPWPEMRPFWARRGRRTIPMPQCGDCGKFHLHPARRLPVLHAQKSNGLSRLAAARSSPTASRAPGPAARHCLRQDARGAGDPDPARGLRFCGAARRPAGAREARAGGRWPLDAVLHAGALKRAVEIRRDQSMAAMLSRR